MTSSVAELGSEYKHLCAVVLNLLINFDTFTFCTVSSRNYLFPHFYNLLIQSPSQDFFFFTLEWPYLSFSLELRCNMNRILPHLEGLLCPLSHHPRSLSIMPRLWIKLYRSKSRWLRYQQCRWFSFFAICFCKFCDSEPGDTCCISYHRIMAGLFFFYFSCCVFMIIFVCFHLFFAFNCCYDAVHGHNYYNSIMILEAVTTERKPINYCRILLPSLWENGMYILFKLFSL